MFCYIFVFISLCTLSVVAMPGMYKEQVSENEVASSYNFPFFRRDQWQARTAKQKTPLSTPVPFVVIHHSHSPPACYETEECFAAMRSMQNYHMDDRDWWDIGYHFAVGSDGAAYEGRGWEILGAHALHFNSVSIGICLIGDWTTDVPPARQLKTAKALIDAGVELGYIHPEYKLVGHRQVRNTECPGEALFQEIQSWDHYSKFPGSPADLINVTEIPDAVKRKIFVHVESV